MGFGNLLAKFGGRVKVDFVIHKQDYTLEEAVNGEQVIQDGKVPQRINQVEVHFEGQSDCLPEVDTGGYRVGSADHILQYERPDRRPHLAFRHRLAGRFRPVIFRGALRTVMAAVTACAVLLSLGGCKVTTSQREPASTKVKEILDSGKGRFDLTHPISRKDAGMPAGSSDVIYERKDHKPFHVLIFLPGGKEISVETRLVTFDSLDSPDPKTGPPTTLDIHHYPATLEAGKDHLLTVAKQFDLDTRAILDWYEEAKNPHLVQEPPTAKTPWISTKLGYLRLSVQGRYSPSVDTPESGQTVVHYLLTWE